MYVNVAIVKIKIVTAAASRESVGILPCVWVHVHVCLSIPDKFEFNGTWLDLSHWHGDVAEHVGLETVGA